jgi:integrative and conjugative element protein (TIGR02256 family)
MISYRSNSGHEEIRFADEVLAHFQRHRQLGPKDREAGGQLFARLSDGLVSIERATGPRASDRRSRFSFRPSRILERIEIANLHRHGLHYIGDWHTHPEPMPTPSGIDRKSIHDTFTKSRHSYAGILMVIVGQTAAPDGLYVAIADANALTPLLAANDEPLSPVDGF